jgi:hypothetical protein
VVSFFWFVLPSSRRLQEALDRTPVSGGMAEPPA